MDTEEKQTDNKGARRRSRHRRKSSRKESHHTEADGENDAQPFEGETCEPPSPTENGHLGRDVGPGALKQDGPEASCNQEEQNRVEAVHVHVSDTRPEGQTPRHGSKKRRGKEFLSREMSFVDKTGLDAMSSEPINGTDDSVERFRGVYRREMTHLHQQLQAFKTQCQAELTRYEEKNKKRRDRITDEVKDLKYQREMLKAPMQLEQLHEEEDLFNKRKSMLIVSEQLLDREETILQRQTSLEEFEREVDELERSIERRYEIAMRKRDELTNHRLASQEEEEVQNHLTKNPDASDPSTRTKDNWNVVHEWLENRQKMTKASLQSCKAQLARTENQVAERDRLIRTLRMQVIELQADLDKKSKKMKDMESRVTLLVQENIARSFDNNSLESGTLGLGKSLDLSTTVDSGFGVTITDSCRTTTSGRRTCPPGYRRQVSRTISSSSTPMANVGGFTPRSSDNVYRSPVRQVSTISRVGASDGKQHENSNSRSQLCVLL